MCLVAGVAVAQAPPAPATPPQATAPPPAPTAANCSPNGAIGANGSGATVGQSNEPLGDRLARSDGVLCPPSGVDPEIRAPTPDNAAKTPVIPPPGSPGGDPSVRPK
jgi:hypothetical protein